jgi:hypothetical protein
MPLMKGKLARATWSFKGHGALSDVDTKQNNSIPNGTRRPLSCRTALPMSPVPTPWCPLLVLVGRWPARGKNHAGAPNSGPASAAPPRRRRAAGRVCQVLARPPVPGEEPEVRSPGR